MFNQTAAKTPSTSEPTTTPPATPALQKCGPVAYTQQEKPVPEGFGTQYAYNMAYWGNTWNGLPYFVDLAHKDQSRRLENNWNTALVKVKGEPRARVKGEPRGQNEKFLNQVSVVALVYDTQGCQHQYNIIDASLGNNWYEHDIAVPIGADQVVTLIFVREDGSDNPQAFGRRQWLQPRAVEEHAKQIIVQEEKLTTARDHYNLKTHVYEENADGDIVRK